MEAFTTDNSSRARAGFWLSYHRNSLKLRDVKLVLERLSEMDELDILCSVGRIGRQAHRHTGTQTNPTIGVLDEGTAGTVVSIYDLNIRVKEQSDTDAVSSLHRNKDFVVRRSFRQSRSWTAGLCRSAGGPRAVQGPLQQTGSMCRSTL